MAKDMFWTTTVFAIILTLLGLAFWPEDKANVIIKYDCRQLTGGLHPDFPAKVIDECKKRSNK